jgi:CheY-like chemotaxis protein
LAAENMMDALRIAEREPFDLLLSDIGLPDGTGHELVKRIREKRDVMAIAVSGFGMEEDVRRSRDAGFFDHLTKPVSLDRLQQAIDEAQEQSD